MDKRVDRRQGVCRHAVGDCWLVTMDLKRLGDAGLEPLQADLPRVAALSSLAGPIGVQP